MYRKSYKGLVIWVLAFLAALLVVCFLPYQSPTVPARLMTHLCTFGIASLSWMIWRTEQVYWYNGVSFEEAEKAGSERRKAYALRHFRLFSGYAIIALLVSMAAYRLRLPWWVDFTVIMIGLIVAAFRTLAYKL